jgi:hypothetical protein
MKFILGAYIQRFPLGKAHKAHFSTSTWCNKSWEACPFSMCLDHFKSHETYCFFHTLPLKLAPTCFIKQCGTSRTQEFECRFVFGLPVDMFGIWGCVLYRWKGLENTFPTVHYKKFKNYSRKTKKEKFVVV